MKDFFISYNQADVRWAEWIAWILEEEGYSTVLQAWDFRPGCNFVLEMDRATKEAERTMPVLSPDFLASNYTPPEWVAAFAQDPESKNRKLLPVKVRSCKPEGLLAAIVHIDIVGLDEDAAKKTIIEGVLAGRAKPESKPHFPAERSITTRPSFPKVDSTSELSEPGDLPSGSRLPFLRNAVFTGREKDLLELANVLLNSKTRGVGITQAAAVTTSPGGMGKSQLAIEFCYRYGRFFQGVHWIQANQDISAEIAACGTAMQLPYWPDEIQEQFNLTLKAWKEGDPHLIVLDSVEDPLIVEELMPKLPRARLLLTTRQSEWPDDLGMVIWPLDTFPRPQSRELLCKLASRLKEFPDVELDEVADRLGDLPLALDLAGRYLKDRLDLSPEDYLVELDSAGSALEHTSLKDWVKHSPTKHATSLAATFSLSWNRLTDDEIDALARQIFKACGYCAPNIPIPRQLLAKVVRREDIGPKLDLALRRLSELGLITPTNKVPSLHLLLTEFARIQDRDAEESILPILAESIGDLANKANKDGLPEQMKPFREHLRAVARTSEASGLQIAGKLWNVLGYHLFLMAEHNEALDNLKKALEIDEKLYGPEHKNVAKDVNDLGSILRVLGDPQGAKKCVERALRIDEKVLGHNHQNVARDVNSLGLILRVMGTYKELKSATREL